MRFRLLAFSCMFAASLIAAPDETPLRLSVAGLVHGHVDGFFKAVKGRTDVQVVGIYDPDRELQKMYARKYGFDDALLFDDMQTMLDKTRPEAVAIFTSTSDHAPMVEACSRHHIHAMMEKPLAVSIEEARRIQRAAGDGGIQVIVNYETTWYRSHRAMWQLVKEQRAGGEIRKMVAMDGHEGPKEIHVGPEFLGWLTNPARNGAGALFDFGCYGANLMTWMMDNQRPLSVTATLQTFKPQTYAGVDDEANVLVKYPGAVGIIQGSWNWPYSRKDFEVYGEHGYAFAVGGNVLDARMGAEKQAAARSLEDLPADERDSISYLKAVVRGKMKPAGLSSLENNMVVVEILEAARLSAGTGKAVELRSR